MRALVVDALGNPAVRLLLRFTGLAAMVADRGERDGQVVDLVDRLDLGLRRATVHPGRRIGALDLPTVLDPARGERPAQHSTVKDPGTFGVGDRMREVGEVAVLGGGG